MADLRKVRARRNISTSLLYQMITLLCGFVVPKLLLAAYGSEVYGATVSIAQFLSYITLLEGGIGGVARAALYKPLAQKDHATISAILTEIRGFFRVVAGIFIGYVILLACSFKSFSGFTQMDQFSTVLLVLAISISTFVQYFFGISNSILLQAAQRSYITNLINVATMVINTLATVVMVLLRCNIITVKLVSSTIFLVKPLVMWLYVSRHFHIAKHGKDGKKHLSQKWSGLGQHIAFFLHSNTDVVVLTCLASLQSVAVYSVYNMIVSHIQNLATSFVSGMEALFGDLLARQEQAQLQDTFDIYEMMLSVVSLVLFSAVAVLILPFVKLYTAGVADANYQEPLFAILLSLSALLYCLRMPYHSLVIAAGHFRQTRVAAYGEAGINIVLSVLLVVWIGLSGVAIGTICAVVFRFVYYAIYVSRNLLFRSITLTVRRFLVNAATLAIVVFFGSIVISRFPIFDYFDWIICGFIVVLLAVGFTVIVNFIFYRKVFVAMIGSIFKKW